MRRDDLARRLAELRHDTNPSRRGKDFERLVADLLGEAHFKVTVNPGAAKPRQTDLIATDSRDTYLVEAKWKQRKFDINDLDSLRARLKRVAGSVVGLVVSSSELTAEAAADIANNRTQPIVVIVGAELDALCDDPRSIRDLLRTRYRSLIEDGSFQRGPEAQRDRSSHLPPRSPLQASARSFTTGADASQVSVLENGGYNQIVFVCELPDMNWEHPGRSVDLNARLPVDQADQLVAALRTLETHGWASDATWTIHQAPVTWNGYGAAACASALVDWKSRCEAVSDLHHTEELTFTDVIDKGLLTLRADLSTSDERRVTHCELTIRLEGVPLDPHPLLQLMDSLNVRPAPSLRTVDETIAVSDLSGRTTDIEVVPSEFIVETQRDEQWVRGFVCDNPLWSEEAAEAPHPDGWPSSLNACRQLICDLRSWHPLDKPRDHYFMHRCESLWIGHVCLVRPIADW